MLYFNHFFSVRAPGQRAVGVDGGERRWLIPSISSVVYILASHLFSIISFPSLGLGDNLLLPLPNCASRSSLTLSFYIFQRELEGLHSLFLFSHFAKGKDTKGTWLFNYQKQMIFPQIMFCSRRIQNLAFLLCLIGVNTHVQYFGHYLKRIMQFIGREPNCLTLQIQWTVSSLWIQ